MNAEPIKLYCSDLDVNLNGIVYYEPAETEDEKPWPDNIRIPEQLITVSGEWMRKHVTKLIKGDSL